MPINPVVVPKIEAHCKALQFLNPVFNPTCAWSKAVSASVSPRRPPNAT